MLTESAIAQRRRELWDELFRRANTADLAEAITQKEAENIMETIRHIKANKPVGTAELATLGAQVYTAFEDYLERYVQWALEGWVEDQRELEVKPENVRVLG